MRPNPVQAAQPAGYDPEILIDLRQVVKTFKNASGAYTVLKDINVQFRQREFASIVGRSGSGKSTLLNMMTGIDHPTSGVVRVDGAYLHTLSQGAMAGWRGRSMGIVFQFFQLLPMLTLLENVMLPMDFCDRFAPAEREPRALALLKTVGLEGLEHKYPAAVGGGQQQSAAVARALANDPPILVADEPTGNLDSKTAERILAIFEQQVALGKTVLIVTHDSALAQRAQRTLVISDGELVSEAISTAFPGLPHAVLLELSHTARPCHFAAGENLPAPGQPLPALLLVTGGALEVVGAGRWNTYAPAERIGPGGWFSHADANALGRGLAGLRAAGPVHGLAWDALPDSRELLELLAESARRAERHGEAGKQRGERRGK